ncbi:MAG TPA: hypothetical protein ENI02_02915 [Candidatus Aminicenantes bacterium]|nr:hypothetical protein [Candidatus Aminicenantes bacterium]
MKELIFVYNADSSFFSTVKDLAHKTISPSTYPCNLCAMTYGNFAMKKEWKEFIKKLELPVEFLHRDEFQKLYNTDIVGLPAVFIKEDSKLSLFIAEKEINRCKHLEDLKKLLINKLKRDKLK